MARLKNATIKVYQCKRCGHQWIPRQKELPNICPRCKSRLWDSKKRYKAKTEAELKAMAMVKETPENAELDQLALERAEAIETPATH